MRVLLVVAAVCCLCAGSAAAQSADNNVYTADAQRQYQYIQGLIVRAAEKVGADLYSFKPTPAVRSLGAVLGHIADANMLLCGVASGKPTDFDKIMKDLSSVQVHEKKPTRRSSSPHSRNRAPTATRYSLSSTTRRDATRSRGSAARR